ncbi:hypothetical protein NIES4103_60380 [Nostoc sp. NIES-4103]|nr:hypothetical protein NIES4103_60380 [Nostoc sp. NIES-4103]
MNLQIEYSAQKTKQNKINNWMLWVILIHCLGLIILGLLNYEKADGSHDLNIYYKSSRNLLAGILPYRDFKFEYPPFSLFAFVLPRILTLGLLNNYHIYAFLFLLENVFFSTIILLLIFKYNQLRHRPTNKISIVFYVLFVMIIARFVTWHYDIFPTLLTVLSLLAVISNRPTLAGISLGFGIAAKLYPVVLLPIFTAYYFAHKSYRAILNLWFGTLGAIILSFIPFAIATGNQLFSFFTYHKERGLQIESLPAGIMTLISKWRLIDIKTKAAYGSINIVSHFDNLVLNLLPWLFIAIYALLVVNSVYCFREKYEESESVRITTLVAYTLLALLVFIITNKVFSPQYIVWIIPFAALLKPRQVCLMLAICISTYLMTSYGNFKSLDYIKILWLNLRNILVVGLSIWVFLDYLPKRFQSKLR